MSFLRQIFLFASIFLATESSLGQRTYFEMGTISVNQNVTTVITASEPIRFVDISTDKVAGDQPIDNTLRLKPKDGEHQDGELLAIVTIITERYRTQYALAYTSKEREAITDKEIEIRERQQYNNPAVTMSKEDMYRYARRIILSKPQFRSTSNHQKGLKMRLNNVYAVGDYFFIDFSVDNKTSIRFDIDEIRLKLKDKKTSKATNAQILELEPAIILDERESFLHGYRNVIAVKKLTFPNDKVLVLELKEKQISGREISITIAYEDILSADGFNKDLF
ncbi:MAG: conjugative transposon protein TraN [Prevotella sp.]|nr:conjugative transposon protein TraN [Prevotella sp.]